MQTPRRSMRALAALAVLAFVPALSHADAAGSDIEQVLARFDEVQDSIHTLSAGFTETTTSVLLTDPIKANGRVYLTKPDSVRWEYIAPEEMRFVIAEDRYTGYFPTRNRAERRNIRRWREQLFRFLGLGQASTELGLFYNISLGDPDESMPKTILLNLEPKKKRVRKRMEAVHFWIDESTFLPVRVEYTAKNGNSRVIVFDEMVVNPELAANIYTVDLPSDVKMTTGFSALSGFSSTND